MFSKPKFKDDVYWLDEEHCYTRNIFDPKRRIYFWFCMTHGLKAMRNQLLASQQNGSKSFVDSYGTNFGWAYVVKLNHYLDNENTPELKRNVRLNDKAANPTNYRKMSVSLAKIIFEHKTLSYGQEKLCQALGITPQCLEVEVQRRLVNNPPIRLGDENGHNTNRSHGYHLEKAKYIYELILKCEKAGDKSPLIEANNKAALTPVVPSAPLPVEDYSFGDDPTEEEIALSERMDADGIIDLIQESIPPPPPSITTPQPPTQAHVELAPQSQYNVIPQETHCDASTLVYMATMNAVYVDMILNKSEKFNKDNYEQYTQYLKNIMTYFHEMKLAQLERRTRGDKKWDVQFLDIITWKNLRVAVCGFVYFAGHMLEELPDEVDGFSYIPMLCSNQSPIESQFSAVRASGHDRADIFAGEVTNKSTRMANTHQLNSSSYHPDDCPDEVDKSCVVGSSFLTKYIKDSLKTLSEWIEKYDTRKKQAIDTIGDDEPLFVSTKIERLAKQINTHSVRRNFVGLLVKDEYFQQWFLLSVDSPDRMQWFNDMLEVDGPSFDKACRVILSSVFQMLEEALTSDKDKCFEKLFRDYFTKDGKDGELSDFEELIQIDLPEPLRNNHTCAIYLAEILKTSFFDSWVYSAVTDIASKPKSSSSSAAETTGVDVDSVLFITNMQSMVGGGLKAAKKEYCPTSSEADDFHELFEKIVLKHDVATGSVHADYDKYNPPELQHANTGGYHLVALTFIPWSVELMRFIVDSYGGGHIVTNRREYIAVNLAKLKNVKVVFQQFKTIVGSLGIVIDDALLSSIHLRIALFAFRAYTKQRNNSEFNKPKALASDTTNLAFRTQVQTGNHGASSNDSNKSKTVTTSQMLNGLGVKGGAKSTTTRRSKAQIIESYKGEPYNTAMSKLLDNKDPATDKYNAVSAKLEKIHCAAVLTLGFNSYTGTGPGLGILRDNVNTEINKDKSDDEFWKMMDRLVLKKRKRDDSSNINDV